MVTLKTHTHTNPEEWVAHLTTIRGEKDKSLIQNAIQLCPDNKLLEKGLGIADILLSLGLDNETLAAAIIYPSYQSHLIHTDKISESLNESINKLLHDILQMQSLGKLQNLEQRSHHQIENLRKMLLAMVSDVRAVLLIIAEQLWKLRNAKNMEKTEQIKLAQETLHIYAPLANRLGIWQLKWEIEDLCLRYLQPEIYTEIAKGLTARRQEREEYIQNMINLLTKMLHDIHLQKFEVNGRVKHIFSIYNKMQRKNVSLDKIYDTAALRVLVPDVTDCYTILGLLQNTWEQIPEEFDDYINRPKANGYRSIHTVVIGPENRAIEIQIRTYQMHQESELGVAAHWRYKEGVLQTAHYETKIALLREIMAWQKEIVSEEKPETKQALQNLFTDRVYVFTPNGDIIDLTQGATPLDFAYQIHSEVGHRCRGAKVGGKIVPLTYQLKTGDYIEILTAKEANPSRDWLNPQRGFLKTPRARAKAAHWFKIHDAVQNISSGRDLLEKELKRNKIHEKYDLDAIAEKMNYKSSDDLLAALAIGDASVPQVAHHIRKITPTHIEPPISTKPHESIKTSGIQILGVNNLLTQTARCCKPLPGDNIIGYVTRNRGIMIHRIDCRNMLNASKNNNQRSIQVSWGEKHTETHPVDLTVRAVDRTGLLRDITTILAGEKINVLGLQTHKAAHVAEADIYITIEISGIEQLKKAISLLQHANGVLKVARR